MQAQEMRTHVQVVFRLQTALFRCVDSVEIEICRCLVEVDLPVIYRIEVCHVAIRVDVAPGIEIEDVLGILEDLDPTSCTVRQSRKGNEGLCKLWINCCGLRIR